MFHISVLSFNILAENCIDFVNPSEYYPNINPKDLLIVNRLPKIIKLLKKYMVDVVLLQEATHYVRNNLIDLLPEYKVMTFSDHKDYDKKFPKNDQYGNLTLLKKGLFTGIKHYTKYLDKSGTAYDITTFKIKNKDKNVIVVNVHYDSESEKLRRSESNMLLKFLSPYMKDWIIIIGGDFNTDNYALHNKYNKFISAVDKKDASSTYLCEKPMIDYIYIRGLQVDKSFIENKAYCSVGKNNVGKSRCMKNTIKTLGSDHYPVYLRATLPLSLR